MWKLRLQRSLARAAMLLGATTVLPASGADPGVAVLLIDTDRVAGTIDERIYGQFLEHINLGISDSLVYFHQVKKFPKPMLSFFRADRIIFACDIAPSGL